MEKRGYHHGNLRESLISAAETLIAERGPAGFSLSDAAKMAGVSVAAPYRHFKDRTALLTEMARIGAERLAERLAIAMREEGFAGMGMAYLAFAREEPAYYEAMYNSGLSAENCLPQEVDPALPRDRGFQLLQDSLAANFGGNAATAGMAALMVVALSHGVASLTKPGSSMFPKNGPSPEDILKEGVMALVRGLGGTFAPPA